MGWKIFKNYVQSLVCLQLNQSIVCILKKNKFSGYYLTCNPYNTQTSIASRWETMNNIIIHNVRKYVPILLKLNL